MNIENLSGNNKARAVKEFIEEIHENKLSTVKLEVYGSEDYWHEGEYIEVMCKGVEDACATWTRTIHPHEGGFGHSLTLIRDLKGDTYQLYTIKSIEVEKEE